MEYFTDPLCSYCFAFENIIETILIDYKDKIELTFHMGGLLKDLERFKNPETGEVDFIERADHWDEVSKITGVKMSGDVWRNDPVLSSYPACKGYYAANAVSPNYGILYLKKIREKVFLECKNISSEDVLAETAVEIGLNKEEFLLKLNSTSTLIKFQDDMFHGTKLGARVFPTLIFYGKDTLIKVSGFKKLEEIEAAYLKALKSFENN